MSNATREFDLAIIGGGPGGYVAAIKAGQLGLKTCLIEKDKVGGTCLHSGCIPTKSLLYSAYLYHLCKRSQEFGVRIGNIEFDLQQIHKKKETAVRRLHNGVKYLLKKNKIEVIEAEGRLAAPRKVLLFKDGNKVGEINASNIILASGSAPMMPEWIPFDGRHILTSDDILKMGDVPSSLIIAGGGDIGIEFGYLYNTLGAAVTIIEMKETILPFEDREISATLQKILTKRGIKIFTETMVKSVSADESGARVEIKKNEDQMELLRADKILVSLGRGPLIGGIGLEKIGIEVDRGFVKVNEEFVTTQPGIYAIGDITGPPLLAHKASQEGILAVLHIAGKELPPLKLNHIPRVNYSHPQVASIGLTTEEAEKKGYEVKTGKFPFSANSKAVISGDDDGGFIKIVADKKYGEILGVHMIGPEVSEFIGGLSLAMSLEATALDISNAIFPHPTLSEVIKEAAHAVEGQAIHI